ncbi:class F sortase [Streptomyces sp. CNQ085]|uniref:class F sortase n=1 Tax=Streptomyces sp. CNQ085 TaxID=2886944 RepID=UPI001F509617|nr:class F sortase [Streptomyces sp. CNQ085]MCI0385683.1 class F sortase [Streptomyces sp. CNQ085]
MYDDVPGGEPRTGCASRLAATAVWAVMLLGLWLWGRELTDPAAAPPPEPARAGAPASGRAPGDGAGHAPLPGAEPRRIDIDGVGVHARIIERGLDREGAVEPPPMDSADTVGWYADGPAPGAEGVALLVGHLDTDTGRAVFHRLPSVRPGDRIHVTRDDGRTAEFTVEDIAIAERADFDPREVYGARRPGRAELRLITCAGAFDRASGTYTANLVVSAHLTGVRSSAGAEAARAGGADRAG